MAIQPNRTRKKRPKNKNPRKASGKGLVVPWKGIGISAFVVIVVVGGAVFAVYASLSQAIVTLTPTQQPISATFGLELGDSTRVVNGEVTQLAGTLFDRQIEETKTVDQIGTEEIDGRAGGKVTLQNGRTGPIKLVKETQLKPEGKDIIFRIQESVEIPAQGEVVVDVLADAEGEVGQIPATKFEIVKLFDGWKVDVFGTSSSPMKGGRVIAEVLTEEQIQSFKDDFAKDLGDRILNELISEHPDLTFPEDGTLVEVGTIDANAEPGQKVDSVELKANIKLVAFAFQEHALLEVALNRLKQEVPEGFVFLGVTPDSFGYAIDSYNRDRGTASFTVSIDGVVVAELPSEQFNKEALSGRDALETANYFEQFEGVEEVDVYFAPFWTTTIPLLKSHTEIVVEKPSPALPTPEALSPEDVEGVDEDLNAAFVPPASVEGDEGDETSSEENLPNTDEAAQE